MHEHKSMQCQYSLKSINVLPPTRNDRPFCDNFVKLGPMKLVDGSNGSVGTYRFDETSTVALGQVLQIEKMIC